MGGPRSSGDPGAAEDGGDRTPGLADLLRERTRAVHAEAERSGIVADLLQARASRRGYALWLRNLAPVYRELESSLERHRDVAGLGSIARREVYRAPALEADLEVLAGPDWKRSLPVLGAGERYVRRVGEAGADGGGRLVAHAYVRFLGDLNGGRILRRLLERSVGLDARALSFYEYPEIEDLATFRDAYRTGIDTTGRTVDADAVIAEALAAFRLNIELSEEVRAAAQDL